MQKTVSFYIKTKDILSANKTVAHYIIKSKQAAALRELASTQGIAAHDDPENAKIRMQAIHAKQELSNQRGRLRRKMNKAKNSAEEIAEALEKQTQDFGEIIEPETIPVKFLFDKFSLKVTVCPPTRRRLDPPNLYPTVKPLIDGLTDACWWEDDDFDHLLDVSFRYGGLSDSTNNEYLIILDIQAITETSEYILDREIHKTRTEGV